MTNPAFGAERNKTSTQKRVTVMDDGGGEAYKNKNLG